MIQTPDGGNGNRLGDNLNYGWSGEGYIMGGSSGVSEVNIINNYFMSGPLTPPDDQPFFFDNNRNGQVDGTPVPYETTGRFLFRL